MPEDNPEPIRHENLDSGMEVLRYRALVDTMNDAFGVIDAEGILTYANHRFSILLDYPLEEIIGEPITSFLDDENLFLIQNNIRKRTKGLSSQYELEWTTRSGKKVQTALKSNHQAEAQKPDHGHDIGHGHSRKKDKHHHADTDNADKCWIHCAFSFLILVIVACRIFRVNTSRQNAVAYIIKCSGSSRFMDTSPDLCMVCA